jgi:HAD superfamily hydrolase (TIGR01490 family)
MASHAMPASYFDVDGTLTKSNLFDTLWFYLKNQQTPQRTLTSMAKTLMQAPALFAAEQVDRSTFNEFLFRGYTGISRDRLHDLADEAFDNVIRPALYKEGLSLIKSVKQAGHRVVLLSGSPDFLLQRLAKMVDADDVIGNRLQFKDGLATGKILPPIVAGPEKARIIKDHAKEHGFDLDDCAAYSDSMSDIPMLSVVGRPAAVNPDFRLRALAKVHRWPVFDLQ